MQLLTPLFVLAVLLSAALELWLSWRQAHHVELHRAEVPQPFADTISAEEHRKAADYTLAKLRLGRVGTLLDAVLSLALTLGGGIAAVDAVWRARLPTQPWLGMAVIATLALLIQLVNLPLSVWRTFRLEGRFERVVADRELRAPHVVGERRRDPRAERRGGAERDPAREREPASARHGVFAVTVNTPPSLRPCTAGLYISSAYAGGRTNTPGVVARAT